VHFAIENIIIILLVGIIGGLLPSTVVPRKGLRLVSDLVVGIIAVLIGNFLILNWRYLIPAENGLLSGKPPKTVNYEPVVLPLAPLRPLLKPIIPRSREEICGSLAEAAGRNDLPTPFLIRLLFQESGFRPEAISRSGAMGMPPTGTSITRSIHCKQFRPPRACYAICKRSLAILALQQPLTTLAQNAFKIGSSASGCCRKRPKTTLRRLPAGRLTRGPGSKPVVRR
jgi:uncharacterized membrane protein YeaQ/YmgE (transglycosylase-associated protein family)